MRFTFNLLFLSAGGARPAIARQTYNLSRCDRKTI